MHTPTSNPLHAAAAAVIALPFTLILIIAAAVGGGATPTNTAATCTLATTNPATDPTTDPRTNPSAHSATTPADVPPVGPADAQTSNAPSLTPAQLANARIITTTGTTMGIPAPGEAIALTAALTESDLTNLPHGDADSLGLFQQRPSQGWGTPTQILNPTYAATQFYRHLLAVPNWQTLPIPTAAQAVERSAHPDAYTHHTAEATALAAALTTTGNAPACTTDDGTTAGPTSVTGYTIPPNTPTPLITVIRFALAQLGKPYQWGGSGPTTWDCSALTQAAYATIGIPLGRTTYIQATQGTPIYDLTTLHPGDLIFIPGTDGTTNHPGHVGMYLGNGVLIQAPHTGDVVKLTPLSQWTNQIAAVRRLSD